MLEIQFHEFPSDQFLRVGVTQPSSFLKFWPLQPQFLIDQFLIKKTCTISCPSPISYKMTCSGRRTQNIEVFQKRNLNIRLLARLRERICTKIMYLMHSAHFYLAPDYFRNPSFGHIVAFHEFFKCYFANFGIEKNRSPK